MSFEDVKIEEAMKALKYTEEKCQTSSNLFKLMKKKIKCKKKPKVVKKRFE